MVKTVTELEKIIGYTFKDKGLLKTALTHTSYSNENPGTPSNERLEFLGDSVLGFLTATELFSQHKKFAEGELTRARAAYVCEGSLASAAERMGITEALLVGRGEHLDGGRKRPSILADAFEALLAAVYLDGGLEPARKYVKDFLLGKGLPESASDFKTALQELTQRDGGQPPSYVLVGETGPDHSKTFEVEAFVGERRLGRGAGRSKKAAEQEAARAALETLGNNT